MLGNPERPIGGLAVRAPAGVDLTPLGREHLADAVSLTRELRGLPPLDELAVVRDRYDALINDPDTIAYLAVVDGAPDGLGVMCLRRRLNFATFEGWLSDLRVRQSVGGRGIEDALVQALVAEWRLRGGHRILASVADGGGDAPQHRETLAGAGFEEGFVDFRRAPARPPAVRPPTGLHIRPLAEGDADAVTRLIAEFGPRRSPVPDRMEAVLRTYAAHARQVASRRAGSLVAELDGVTVGACTMEWQRPFWTPDLHAWIPDLVVTEPVRGRGIGRALLAAALQSAEVAGAAEVRLASGPQRIAANGLYRSVGFEIVGRTWVLRADEPSP
jgi:GNAT superfamily N-acetyltransferase